jgi:hypothetical protein
LTPEDISAFIKAATERTEKPAIIRKLEADHPVRMAGLRSGFRWFQRQIVRAGYSKEDARWML